MIAEVGASADAVCSNSAHVAELVDAHGSGPCAARCGGSSPSVGTIYWQVSAAVCSTLLRRDRRSDCGVLISSVVVQQYQCPRGGIGRRAWFRSMCRKVWGFESLRGHQNIKGRLMKINRPFAFWRPRARRLRALRVGLEGLALQGQTGSRHVTESLRGHQNIKGRLMKINRPFAFWRPRARRLRALRVGLEGLALQGQTGSRHVTERPPWAPKHKRSIDENQSAFCVLGTASISRANSPCSSKVSPQVAAPTPHVPRTATDQAPRRSYLAKPVCACLATASSQNPGLQFFFRPLSTFSHQAATRPASHLAR